MPVYTYRCENCEYQFDKYQSFKEDALKQCPQCKKMKLYKVYRPAGIVFKGSGYYVTDNRSAKSSLGPSNGKTEKSDNGKSESKEKKDTKESKESKTESK